MSFGGFPDGDSLQKALNSRTIGLIADSLVFQMILTNPSRHRKNALYNSLRTSGERLTKLRLVKAVMCFNLSVIDLIIDPFLQFLSNIIPRDSSLFVSSILSPAKLNS